VLWMARRDGRGVSLDPTPSARVRDPVDVAEALAHPPSGARVASG
jgi:hypothetical protein